MFKELQLNVWDILDENSVLYILTNNSIYSMSDICNLREYEYNPMFGGVAYEAYIRNNQLPIVCAQAIKDDKYDLGIDFKTQAQLMRFPTMHNIGEKADIKLIEFNLNKDRDFCLNNKDKKIYLPRPGCGIGGLD